MWCITTLATESFSALKYARESCFDGRAVYLLEKRFHVLFIPEERGPA